jgi:hypothetical protein
MDLKWKTCGGHAKYTRRHFLFGAATAGPLRVHADAQTTVCGDPRSYLHLVCYQPAPRLSLPGANR